MTPHCCRAIGIAGLALASAAMTAGCTAARTHARVAPGWNLGLSGGAYLAPPPGAGSASTEERASLGKFAHAELDIEYAGTTVDHGGWALQLKVPLSLTRL